MANDPKKKGRAIAKRREKAFRAVNELVNKMNVKRFTKLPEYQKLLRRVLVTGTRDLWTLKQKFENLYKQVMGV
jgi:Txe/YoeB family toxin of Txe-Axe toxin-antitoxin module